MSSGCVTSSTHSSIRSSRARGTRRAPRWRAEAPASTTSAIPTGARSNTTRKRSSSSIPPAPPPGYRSGPGRCRSGRAARRPRVYGAADPEVGTRRPRGGSHAQSKPLSSRDRAVDLAAQPHAVLLSHHSSARPPATGHHHRTETPKSITSPATASRSPRLERRGSKNAVWPSRCTSASHCCTWQRLVTSSPSSVEAPDSPIGPHHGARPRQEPPPVVAVGMEPCGARALE